jgi:tRNA G10  N-methylase Trm11
MQYFFILGRNPKLSLAELFAVFERDNVQHTLIANNKEFAIFDIKQKINAKELINKLGGTIKIGEILTDTTADLLAQTIQQLLPVTDKKIIFGINDYTGKTKPINLSKQIKKETDQSIRFVFPQAGAKYLSSVATEKNKLLTATGAEFNLFLSNKGFFARAQNDSQPQSATILVGKTSAVQPFETFSKFDYGRPGRDAESGMLPPKVATMMLNLSQANIDDELLDPFCGSGTILQQAFLLGFKNITGTDLSAKAIEDSQQNIAWLEQQTSQKSRINVQQLDARQLTQEIAPKSINAIVTEPFLGKPIWGNEQIAEIKKQVRELEAFYIGVLKQLNAVLKNNGTIIIIIPSFIIKNQIFNIDISKLIAKTDLTLTDKWQYSRPGQHVIRNIYKLTKE